MTDGARNVADAVQMIHQRVKQKVNEKGDEDDEGKLREEPERGQHEKKADGEHDGCLVFLPHGLSPFLRQGSFFAAAVLCRSLLTTGRSPKGPCCCRIY